ncbi:MAG TPA: penicillin-binding protein activator [Rhodanobacteraceae bacterium]|nr:penicillin-binding protein activator [Rhodanobacteraceae bacterium]
MHRIRWLACIAALAGALAMAGCATLGPAAPPTASPAAEAQYAHAQELYRAGNFAAAATAFQAAAQAYPALRDRADLGAAASYRSLGQFERTAALLREVNPRHLAAGDAARYQVLMADASLHAGHADAALKQLASLPASAPAEVQNQALDVTARARLLLGDRVGAARALVQRVTLLPAAVQAAARQRAVAVLVGMGHAGLAQFKSTLAPDDPLVPYVTQALGQRGGAAVQVLPHPAQPVGTLVGGAPPQGYAMPARVALLLPATGPVAVAAQAVRDGFFMAYFRAPAAEGHRPSIKVYDTGGTPSGALAAYQQAVGDGAQLVVGPLSRAAVGAVFAQSTLAVPVLALNHPQNDAHPPTGSTEFGLMPEAEGAQLAAHMVEQGLHTAIVFRSDDDTASRTFDAFRAQFTSLGGQIAHDVVLPRSAVDFASQAAAAVANPGPETGVVALLRPIQGRLLLPQLRLARSTLPVFATSMIYSGIPNATADGDLDGVQFCDEPWLYDAQAGLPGHAALAQQLETATGPAARLFAFGMDAYALLPYLGWLQTHPDSYLPGATGQLSMSPLGQVQRTPIWVQFQGGIAQPVSADLQVSPPSSAAPAPQP